VNLDCSSKDKKNCYCCVELFGNLLLETASSNDARPQELTVNLKESHCITLEKKFSSFSRGTSQ